MKTLSRPAAAGLLIAALALLAVPLVTTQFIVVAIAIKTLWLGIVAMSLIFLAANVGMVSLSQTAIYGCAGYVLAKLTVDDGWSIWPAVAVAILAATALSAVIALVTVRSYGIYLLMLTLAIGVFLYYFALQYRPFTHGFSGLNGVPLPRLLGLNLADPTNFYYFALAVAVGALLAVRWVASSPFGLTLRGIRDSKERMAALGYDVALRRIAAFTFAGLIAATGGVLSVWYNGQISPGSVDLTRTIDVLIVAVIGGLYRLEGAFLGALVVTLLHNYASDYTNRYNTVIGLLFIAVLMLSPGGLAGLAETALAKLRHRAVTPTPAATEPVRPTVTAEAI